jgi:hypothetical protein
MSDLHAAPVNGIRLSYRVAGDTGAPPVLLLPGRGFDHTDWAKITVEAGHEIHATRPDDFIAAITTFLGH